MDVLVWNVRPCSDKGFDTRDLSYEEEDTFMISIDMYNNDVGKRFMKQTGALGPHPLFCFISFIGIYYPLTDIVIVHIVYINESNPYTPLMSISHKQRQQNLQLLTI